jgi:hypothetical protein
VRRLVGAVLVLAGLAGAGATLLVRPASRTVVASAPPTAEIRSLVAEIVDARRSGGADVAARLDPTVLKIYGEDQCRKVIEKDRDREYAFTVGAIIGPGRWTYSADGNSFYVYEAYEVEGNQQQHGKYSPAKIHVAKLRGKLVWFTDCGTPKSTATS